MNKAEFLAHNTKIASLINEKADGEILLTIDATGEGKLLTYSVTNNGEKIFDVAGNCFEDIIDTLEAI